MHWRVLKAKLSIPRRSVSSSKSCPLGEPYRMSHNPYESPATTAGERSEPDPMAETSQPSSAWWGSRRLRYNIGLICAGVLAFVCYAVVCFTLLPRVLDESQIEVSPFTTLVQGVGYLFMMGIANLCFFLGPFCENFVRPCNVERYRRIAYGLGFWFSVLLPFGIPALLTVKILFFPDSFEQ